MLAKEGKDVAPEKGGIIFTRPLCSRLSAAELPEGTHRLRPQLIPLLLAYTIEMRPDPALVDKIGPMFQQMQSTARKMIITQPIAECDGQHEVVNVETMRLDRSGVYIRATCARDQAN